MRVKTREHLNKMTSSLTQIYIKLSNVISVCFVHPHQKNAALWAYEGPIIKHLIQYLLTFLINVCVQCLLLICYAKIDSCVYTIKLMCVKKRKNSISDLFLKRAAKDAKAAVSDLSGNTSQQCMYFQMFKLSALFASFALTVQLSIRPIKYNVIMELALVSSQTEKSASLTRWCECEWFPPAQVYVWYFEHPDTCAKVEWSTLYT